jgi:hypothetical protein
MSDLFSLYEDSLNIVLRKITIVIESIPNLSKEKTENALEDANNNIKEAEKIVNNYFIKIKQMDLEVSSSDNKLLANRVNN